MKHHINLKYRIDINLDKRLFHLSFFSQNVNRPPNNEMNQYISCAPSQPQDYDCLARRTSLSSRVDYGNKSLIYEHRPRQSRLHRKTQ